MGAQDKHHAIQITPEQRNVGSAPKSPQSESTASTMDSSSSCNTKRTSNRSPKKVPKKVQQHQEDTSKVVALQAEITRLHRIQDRMEAYQSDLEKEHIIYQRQIEALECSLQRVFHKLESWLEDTRLLNERLERQEDLSTEHCSIVQDRFQS